MISKPTLKYDHCDICKKGFPRSELSWLRDTASLHCPGCKEEAEELWQKHCRELDEEDQYE